ncbi:hypothetical protein AB0F81_50725, partial [Actinoplanes sp. NPDC024001]
MLAATRELLDSLDPLPYRRRMASLAAWARTSPERAEVCADLRGRGAYERHLALTAAMVARDRDGIEEATRDPQPSIRLIAVDAVLRAGRLTGRLAGLAAVDRRRVYRTLRRIRAPHLADALIGEVRTHYGDFEAARVLPSCGPATVRALLPDLEMWVSLSALAARHPGIVLERTGQRLAEAVPEERDRIWRETSAAVLTGDPAGVLDLLERYGPHGHLPGGLTAYGRLADHDAGRVARLLTAQGRVAWLVRTPLPAALLRRLAALPVADLAPLARAARDNGFNLPALLAEVPPARRGELYDAAVSDVDTVTRIPPHDVMAVLPAAVRIREATRVLGLPKIREQEAQVVVWSAYLAWPRASAALDAPIRSGDADDRAQGYRLLVAAAGRARDPQAVAEVLA